MTSFLIGVLVGFAGYLLIGVIVVAVKQHKAKKEKKLEEKEDNE